MAAVLVTALNSHKLKLLPHSLGVAYHGSSLVCYRATYLEYKSPCRIVYAIPHISDIRELAMEFFIIDRIIFQKLMHFLHNLSLWNLFLHIRNSWFLEP